VLTSHGSDGSILLLLPARINSSGATPEEKLKLINDYIAKNNFSNFTKQLLPYFVEQVGGWSQEGVVVGGGGGEGGGGEE